MNILLDPLPTEIDGVKLHTNFRNYILLELLLLDEDLTDSEKLAFAVDLVFAEPVLSVEWAVEKMLWFYRCGEPEHKPVGQGIRTERAYDFQVDAARIYAAFEDAYGIDLNTVKHLHWWKFSALFESLPETCYQKRVMSYRLTDTSKMKGEELAFYERMKSLYRLKSIVNTDSLSLEARNEQLKQRAQKRFKEAVKWKSSRSINP